MVGCAVGTFVVGCPVGILVVGCTVGDCTGDTDGSTVGMSG